ELGLFRGEQLDKRLTSNDAKSKEGKLAKNQFRTLLAERAVIRLHANEGSSFLIRQKHRSTTRRIVLRGEPTSSGRRVGILPSRAPVQVQERKGRWFRVKSDDSDLNGWVHRRRIR